MRFLEKRPEWTYIAIYGNIPSICCHSCQSWLHTSCIRMSDDVLVDFVNRRTWPFTARPAHRMDVRGKKTL